jgi:hypothetical protein
MSLVESDKLVESLVEIKLNEEDNFLKVRETLTRIGVSSRKTRTIFQSCHILHKRGKYYIVHFKELFMLDGKPFNFSDEDRARRNSIINLLSEWGLIAVLDSDKFSEEPVAPISQIKILSHKEKNDWNLVPKYNIGKR